MRKLCCAWLVDINLFIFHTANIGSLLLSSCHRVWKSICKRMKFLKMYAFMIEPACTSKKKKEKKQCCRFNWMRLETLAINIKSLNHNLFSIKWICDSDFLFHLFQKIKTALNEVFSFSSLQAIFFFRKQVSSSVLIII